MTNSYFISSDGTKIWYRYIKSKTKNPCLLFLHGLTGSSSGWDFIYPHYAKKGYSIFMMDARGHGLSEIPENIENLSLAKIADDLKQIIDQKKIQKVVLIGHSYGGIIAQKFCEKYLEKVEKLILISTAHKISVKRQKRILNQLLYYGTYFLFSVIHPLRFEKTQKQIDYTEFVQSHDLNLKRLYHDLRVTSLNTFLPFFKEIIATDFTEMLPKLKIPVLIIHGKHDILISVDIAENMHKLIKNSIFSVINTNHISILNSPKEIIKQIDRFIE